MTGRKKTQLIFPIEIPILYLSIPPVLVLLYTSSIPDLPFVYHLGKEKVKEK
jgi:hypothetical protein